MVASTISFRIHETALAGNNESQGKKIIRYIVEVIQTCLEIMGCIIFLLLLDNCAKCLGNKNV